MQGRGRGVDPAAEATILCADVRPYRNAAAAASEEDGRGVGHGRGYKAAAPWRQGLKSSGSTDQRNAIGISTHKQSGPRLALLPSREASIWPTLVRSGLI